MGLRERGVWPEASIWTCAVPRQYQGCSWLFSILLCLLYSQCFSPRFADTPRLNYRFRRSQGLGLPGHFSTGIPPPPWQGVGGRRYETVPAGMSLKMSSFQRTHFTDGYTEAQRGGGLCPRLPRWYVRGWGMSQILMPTPKTAMLILCSSSNK